MSRALWESGTIISMVGRVVQYLVLSAILNVVELRPKDPVLTSMQLARGEPIVCLRSSSSS